MSNRSKLNQRVNGMADDVIKKEKSDKLLAGIQGLFIKLIQIILYVPIQIIFIPFAIIGIVIGMYKEMVLSKKYGVSFSAGQALQPRYYMHYFGTRPDPITVEFTKNYPCESHFGLLSIMGPLIIAQRLFGLKTRFSKIVEPGKETYDSTAGIRAITFDKIMEKYVDDMDQIVMPGCGFDFITLEYTKAKNLKVFEIDLPNTLKIKVDTLEKAGIEHDWITYIPVDYSKESWVEKLLEAGFDKTKKTLFIWQSVSLYLEEDTVKDSLREMADLCTEGSVIAQDFYSKAFLGSNSMAVKSQRNIIEKNGEPWIFGIDMSDSPKEAVESFLKECGLKMTEYIQFGEKLDIEPFYCIVEGKKL